MISVIETKSHIFFFFLVVMALGLCPVIPSEGLAAKIAENDAETFYQRGVGHVKGTTVRKDFHEAVKWLQKSADMGYAKAQFSLSIRYMLGQGVKKNYKKAFGWLKKAADQGLVEAQYGVGLRYYWGQGTTKDSAKAMDWLAKAAQQGHKGAEYQLDFIKAQEDDLSAQYRLSKKYRDGSGVDKDNKKEIFWLEKAAKGGHVKAQYELAKMFLEGNGAQRNTKQAGNFFQLAAEAGHAAASLALGEMYYKGVGKKKNLARAYAFIFIAAEAGVKRAVDIFWELEKEVTEDQVLEAVELIASFGSSMHPPDELSGQKNNGPSGLVPIAGGGAGGEMAAHQEVLPGKNSSVQQKISEYETRLVFDSKNIQLLKNLAVLYSKNGQTGKAIDSLSIVIKLVPDDAMYRVMLANIYFLNKNMAKAKEVYHESLTINPGLGWVHRDLADIYMNQKKYAAAWKHTRHAEALGVINQQHVVAKLRKVAPKLEVAKKEPGSGQLHLRQIVVSTEQAAEKIVRLLQSGKDFSQLASQNSIAPYLSNGGYLGPYKEEEFADSIATVINSLDPSEISPVIQTVVGFHIFQLFPVFKK